MAEQINIFEVDIDTRKIIEKLATTKGEIDRLKENVKSLTEQQKKAQKEFLNTAVALEQLEKAGKGEGKEAEALKKRQKDLKRELDACNEAIVRQQAQIRAHTAEMRNDQKILDSHHRAVYDQKNIITETNGSIKQLSAALSNNKKIYSELTKEERENAEIGGRLKKIIEEQDKEYKALHNSIGNTQVNVGNYTQAIEEALAKSGVFGGTVNKIKGVVNQFTPAFERATQGIRAGRAELASFSTTQGVATGATTLFSGALKILRGALISTGIGALVVALGSLVAWLTTTQAGIDKVNQVLAGLGAAISVVTDRFAKIGGAIFGLVTGQKSLSEAWKEGKEACSGIGKEMAEEVKQAVELEKKNQQLHKSEVMLDIQRASTKRRLKELKTVIDDESKSIEERQAALKEATKLEEDLSAKQLKLAQEKLHAALGFNKITEEGKKIIQDFESGAMSADEALKKLGLSESTMADLEKFRDMFVDFENKRTENASIKLKNQKDEQKLNKEDADLRKKRHEEFIARQEKEIEAQRHKIDLYLEENTAVAQSLAERLQIEEEAKNQRLAVLEKERQLGIISQEKYQEESQKITLEFLRTRAELSVQASEQELQAYIKGNQSKREANQILTAELVEDEQLRIETIFQKQVEALEREKLLKQEAREWDYQAEAEHQQRLQDLKEGKEQQMADLKKDFDTQQRELQKEEEALDFAEKIARMEEEGADEWAIKEAQLDFQQAQELEKLNQRHEQGKITDEQYQRAKTLMEQKYEDQRTKIHKAAETAKLQNTQAVLGGIKGLFEEQSAVGKAAAVAEATINTYLSATKARATYPEPFGSIMAGVAVAMGMKNVQKIVSTNTKFEKGGLVVGKRHSEGGVPFTVQGVGGYEMEGGEYISSREVVKRFFPQLQMMTEMVHGKQTAYRPRFFEYGGVVNAPTVTAPAFDIEELKNAIKSGALEGTHEGAASGTFSGAFQGTATGVVQQQEQQRINNLKDFYR